jgi:hypothetical protein
VALDDGHDSTLLNGGRTFETKGSVQKELANRLTHVKQCQIYRDNPRLVHISDK